jgi:nitroreductase
MDALDAIFTRKSIRSYTDQPISQDTINTLIRAAMSAPSAHNQHPWHFVVIQDHDSLVKISENFTYGKMLATSPLAILLCCDTNNLRNPAFWTQDMSAATQNILLASRAQDLGAVRIGLYPEEASVKFITEYFQLPEGIVPFSLVSIGYPAEEPAVKNRFSEDRVHHNHW